MGAVVFVSFSDEELENVYEIFQTIYIQLV